ncbi:interferon regulatory factor 3 isoform X2 [Parambassis ranga]|uniref:Interferon regulatory factor 3 isoform X2 n=1 Tax=Parambassis ranga TaxID=210632 RepID=A0A6P7KCY7_9TELE|nr:interferon regulatory factor 3-like isoform X2 [Parambassis ranga]
MSHSKPLLIPWLKVKIDSSIYPGVFWTNPERTEFSIPWKHALRQDSSDTDILIFKAWAEVSGNGRAQGDPSVWKRNFRSALRAKGFKLVADNKNDTANPHKVFHWPDDLGSGANSSAGSQEQDDNDLFEEYGLPIQESQVPCLFIPEENVLAQSSASQDILQACLEGLNIGPGAEGTAGFEPPPEQQQSQNQAAIGGHPLPGQQQYPVTFKGAVCETGLPEQPAHPMEEDVGGACDEQLAAHFIDTLRETRAGDHFKTQFKVSVYYRGVKVKEQLVENEAGIRLVYRPDLIGTDLDYESGLSVVSLPRLGTMLDQTQASLTQRILDKLGDGLDVGVSDNVVYGQRRGEIRAFWSLSKFDHSTQPQEVSKLQPQRLYMVKDFLQGILDFIGGREGPPSSLFFCLGEKWPDPDNRPWEKKLITVEVVLTSMELLKTIAVAGGASSLQSVELQMSLEEMMELY